MTPYNDMVAVIDGKRRVPDGGDLRLGFQALFQPPIFSDYQKYVKGRFPLELRDRRKSGKGYFGAIPIMDLTILVTWVTISSSTSESQPTGAAYWILITLAWYASCRTNSRVGI
jgi:hypothetical protein